MAHSGSSKQIGLTKFIYGEMCLKKAHSAKYK
jgi:hypothetical protein